MFKFVLVFTILSVGAELTAQLTPQQAYEKSCIACHGAKGSGIKDAKLSGPNLTILKDEFAKEQFGLILSGKRRGEGVDAMLKALEASKLSKEDLNKALTYALKLKEAPAYHIGGGDPQKGKAKYEMICLHCHGAKGEGYANPALPSPRLAGQADFYIINQIKNFKSGLRDNDSPASQQMKAMSLTLTSEEDILNVAAYIRSLDKIPASSLENLSYKIYHGSWSKMPDFTKLTPNKEGNSVDNLIDYKVAELEDNYAIVFTGDFLVPEDNEYLFQLNSDDGSQLFINDEMVINHDGIHHLSVDKTGTIKLKKGVVKLRVHYYEKSGHNGLELVWRKKDDNTFQALTTTATSIKNKAIQTSLPIEPDKIKGEAIVFRNFIKGASSRSIAVGYPEGTHIVFDASNMNFAMMWRGKFLDAGAMYSGRGTSFMEPQGKVVNIANFNQVGILESPESPWPKLERNSSKIRNSDLKFEGYTLDKLRYPTFTYSLGDFKFNDFMKPINSNGTGISRKVSVTSAKVSDKLWFKVAMDNIIQEGEFFKIGTTYKVKAANAKMRDFGKTKELLIPFIFKDGQAVIEINYYFEEM